MIKFENTEVFNFEGAFRGMRNPLNSWEMSDSDACPDGIGFEFCDEGAIGCLRRIHNIDTCKYVFCIGENDLALAQKLIKAGSDHRKFMRQILVSVDITAPLYWWKEFDTYKVGTVANSCSTMHTIHKKEFTLDDFSVDYIVGDVIAETYFNAVINALNHIRHQYLQDKNKAVWYKMIQLLPSSYNQKRTVTLNYEVLRNIRGSRHNHKLDEWGVDFMEWIDSLPYADELIKYGG